MTAKARALVLCTGGGAGVAALVLSGALHRAAAEAPQGRYQVASGEVLDTQTGLVWQQVSSASTLSWADAQAYCASPWRVPSMKELQTLVDEAETDPAIDQAAFPDVSAAAGYDYWSSSPVAGLSPIAWWYVEFRWGGDSYGDPSYACRVRCVR
jgi:hypothetical protein